MKANPLEQDLNHVLEHTSGLWEQLRNKRIFVSGGTGFFGHWLLESLVWANTHLDLNASAVVLTRNRQAFVDSSPHLALNSRMTLLQGDVRSFDFPAGRFEFVIHAATDSSPLMSLTAPTKLLETMVNGTRRMLEFARMAGTTALLFTSSGAVYGKQPSEMTHMPEEFDGAPQPGDPRSAYAEGKRTSEHLCAQYGSEYGLDCKIARCFAFAGPYLPLDASFAIGSFIRDSINGGPVRVLGDGTAYRSYLYSADLAIWLWTILFRGVSGRPYNVGSEDGLTVGDLARKVARLAGNERGVQVFQEPRPGLLPGRYVPSTRRAAAELGLRQWIELDEAILSTAQWNRQHGSDVHKRPLS